MTSIWYLIIGLLLGALLQRIIVQHDLERQARAIRELLDIERNQHELAITRTKQQWLKITTNAYNAGIKEANQEQASA